MPWRKGTDWVCPHNNTRTYNFFFFVDLIFLYLSPKSLLPLSCQQPFQQTHYQLCKPCLPSFSLKPCSWLASWCCRVQARVLVPVRRSSGILLGLTYGGLDSGLQSQLQAWQHHTFTWKWIHCWHAPFCLVLSFSRWQQQPSQSSLGDTQKHSGLGRKKQETKGKSHPENLNQQIVTSKGELLMFL